MTESNPPLSERRSSHPMRRSSDRANAQDLSAVVDVLAHDLRGPLSTIVATAGLLGRRVPSEVAAQPVNRILNSAERMSRMISQLLDFTRIKLGTGMVLDHEKMDVSAVCQNVVGEVEALHACSIAFESTGDLRGSWDPERLSQLLWNLLDNACRHRRAGTTVGLRADGSQLNRVALEVQNDGAIALERLPTVFNPPEWAPRKNRETGDGLGIGLYISLQIATAHGGTIGVESNEQNGTCFRVELPRHADSAT